MENKTIIRFEATPLMLKALKIAKYPTAIEKTRTRCEKKTYYQILMEVKEESGFIVYDRKPFVERITNSFKLLGYKTDVGRAMIKVGYTLVAVADTSYLENETKGGKSDSIYLSVKKIKK
jgi:hypothetical protein